MNDLAPAANINLILKYYLLLRCFIVLGLAIGVGAISIYFELRPPWLPCALIAAALAIATLITAKRSAQNNHTSNTDIAWNLLLDIGALFVFAYYTGGATNPFVTLFALPVIFAAATLPIRASAVVGLAAIAAFTITLFVSSPLSPDKFRIDVSNEYLWGNWYAFVLLVAGIAALVARLSRNIRQRDRELAEAREDALQSDRAVALGTLAAQAAEDLGTPLATIAVIAKDLENEATDTTSRQQLEVLNQAVGSCKNILGNLAADAGQQRADSGHATTADEYLKHLVATWGHRHPEFKTELQQHGAQPAPQILADKVLDQALLTLIDSATRSDSKSIVFSGNWNSDALALNVTTNDAPGNHSEAVDPSQPDHNQLPIESAGAGLLLAIATVKRMGGDVNFDVDRASLRFSIPLHAIRTA